jgi:hypothetical protein
VKAIFNTLFLLLAANPISANAADWPTVKEGSTLVVQDRKKLPIELATITKQLCGPERENVSATVEFYGVQPNHAFAVVRCSFGIAWTASLFENVKDKPVPVSLSVGDTSSGFEVVSAFSSIDLNVAKKLLQVSFETDACGTDGIDTFTYFFESDAYKLVKVDNVDCDFVLVKKIWQARDFKN